MEGPWGGRALDRIAQMRAITAQHRQFLEVIEPVLTNLQCRRQSHIAMEVWALLEEHVRGLQDEERLLEASPSTHTQDHLDEHALLRDYVANVNKALRTWRLEPDFVWVSACLLANWLRSHMRRLEQLIEAQAPRETTARPVAARPARSFALA